MAIDTTLLQFCRTCGEATITTGCRRLGVPDLCCSRCCCPPGFDVGALGGDDDW